VIAAPTTKAPQGTKARPSAITVERDLRQRISSGALASGHALPSLRDLSLEYGVAINTVSRALKSLVEDGYLRSEGLRGRYVAHSGSSGSRSVTARHIHEASATSHIAASASIAIVAYLDGESRLGEKNWGWHGVRAIEQAFLGSANITLGFHNRYSFLEASTYIPTDATLRELDAQNPSAIAVLFPDEKSVEPLLEYAEARGIPMAMMTDMPCQRPRISEISFDDASAAHDATMHLLRRGYENICLFGLFPSFWAEHRIDGIKRALRTSGIAPEKLLVSHMRDYDGHMSQEDFGFELAGEFLDRLPSDAGVVAVNDNAAVGLTKAAQERGLKPGTDFGLVGFDDIAAARLHGITSMRPPISAMGMEAARVLSAALSGAVMPHSIVFRSHLVPRQSTLRMS
jgi:DNA-binding LacI/PurR family transcriptional regulator/DNA-binding transcriptional regulator YhcF (GntR family)